MVKVPGGQSLLLDAKVSLNAYQDAFVAVDEGEKTAHLAAHAAAMKAHVNALGAKSYWAQFPDTPDFVIMFVPGEHFLAAALDQDTALWDYAFERKVLLEIGRAHVWTPVTNAHLVCRLLLEKNNTHQHNQL